MGHCASKSTGPVGKSIATPPPPQTTPCRKVPSHLSNTSAKTAPSTHEQPFASPRDPPDASETHTRGDGTSENSKKVKHRVRPRPTDPQVAVMMNEDSQSVTPPNADKDLQKADSGRSVKSVEDEADDWLSPLEKERRSRARKAKKAAAQERGAFYY